MKEITKSELRAIANRIKKAQKVTLKALRNNEENAVKSILDILKRLSKEVKLELSGLDERSFKLFQLRRLQSVIDGMMEGFKQQLENSMRSETKKAVEIARNFWIEQFDNLKKVDDALPGIMPIVSEQSLSVLANLSVEVIKGLADETAKKLKIGLQQAIIGQKTPFEAARDLEKIIGPRGNVGASAAADRIVRTEVNRAYSMTDELFRQENIDERPEDAPRLIKIWVTANDDRVRLAHEEMDGLYVDAEDDFSVPVAGKKGQLTGKKEPMTGPHDPKASAGNVVNCRCTTYTVPEYLADEFSAKPQN